MAGSNNNSDNINYLTYKKVGMLGVGRGLESRKLENFSFSSKSLNFHISQLKFIFVFFLFFTARD